MKKWHKMFTGHILDVIDKIEDESIQMMFTSPPYYSKFVYPFANTMWGGDKDCDHKFDKNRKYWFNQFCMSCGGWYGQLGTEPTPEQYIEHFMMIMDALEPKLKHDGTVWINIKDSYSGSGNASGHKKDTKNLGKVTSETTAIVDGPSKYPSVNGYKRKCRFGIPEQLVTAMIKRGWYFRSRIVWVKPNHRPENVKDRPTNDHELIYLFSKRAMYKYNQIKVEAEDGFKNQRTTWEIDTENNPIGEHEATFSTQLPFLPIKAGTDFDDIVIDPFAGTATTGICAINQGRKFIGVEINPTMVDHAKGRLERETFTPLQYFL